MDAKIADYFRLQPGPLGSTDRKCPINIETLHKELNADQSEIAPLWTEKEVTRWAKTLGKPCGAFQPAVYGVNSS